MLDAQIRDRGELRRDSGRYGHVGLQDRHRPAVYRRLNCRTVAT
jgi:hypothetical protein